MMSIALTIVATVLAVLAGVVGRAYLRARALRPAVYRHLSLTDPDPFLRSWAVWLGNRGEILVGHEHTDPIVHFRKRTYKRRPNVLFFRFRNADESRRSFPAVWAALDAAGVDYELERTRRTRQPRALVVALDPADVLMPAAAMRLIDIVFGALQANTATGFRGTLPGDSRPCACGSRSAQCRTASRFPNRGRTRQNSAHNPASAKLRVGRRTRSLE